MNQDANDKGKDALSAEEQGRPSTPEGKTPSEKDVVFLTPEEQEKAMADRHSALDKEIASLKKQVTAGTSVGEELAQVRQQMVALQEMADTKELEAAEGDPERMAAYRRRQQLLDHEKQLREREAAVKQTEIEHGEAMERVKKLALLETAQSIAKDFPGVEAADLLDLGLTGDEQMRKAAEKLAEKAKGAPPVIKADSAISSGLGVDLSGMSAEEKIVHALKHPKK